jgi:hypothetical protein
MATAALTDYRQPANDKPVLQRWVEAVLADAVAAVPILFAVAALTLRLRRTLHFGCTVDITIEVITIIVATVVMVVSFVVE